MPSAFWIALGVTVLVIAAHVALFVFFLRDPKKKPPPDEDDDDG
jgi:hypothetical protein